MLNWLKEKIDNIIIDNNRGNADGCSEQYWYSSALYLLAVMSQCYSVIIDWGISAPGHGKEVVDGINDISKHCIKKLSNVQLQGSKRFDSHMQMLNSSQKNDVIISN